MKMFAKQVFTKKLVNGQKWLTKSCYEAKNSIYCLLDQVISLSNIHHSDIESQICYNIIYCVIDYNSYHVKNYFNCGMRVKKSICYYVPMW